MADTKGVSIEYLCNKKANLKRNQVICVTVCVCVCDAGVSIMRHIQ